MELVERIFLLTSKQFHRQNEFLTKAHPGNDYF